MVIGFIYATRREMHRLAIQPIFDLMVEKGYDCRWGQWEPTWGVIPNVASEDITCYVTCNMNMPPHLQIKTFAHWHGLHLSEQGYASHLWKAYLSPGEWWLEELQHESQAKELNHKGHFPVTGWAKLDTLFKPNLKDDTITKYNLDLPYDKTVLYAPTGNWHWATSFDKSVMHILEMFEGLPYNLLVKISPYTTGFKFFENFKNYFNEEKNPKHIKRIPENDDITPLYLLTDVLISDGSSSAFEFVTLDKPAIALTNMHDTIWSLCADKRHCPHYWTSNNLKSEQCRTCITVKSSLEYLRDTVIQTIENPNEFATERRKWAKKLNAYVDGRCAERCVKAIERIVDL